jgi:hypothetical protein
VADASRTLSNAFLIAIAGAPAASWAIVFLLGRQLLSQMDVPARQACVMAVVADREREAAASLHQPVAHHRAGGDADVLLWLTLRDVTLRDG